MTKKEQQILTVTCFGHFLSHFNMLTFPAIVLPLAARLDMDFTVVLQFSFYQYLLFGLTSLPWGYVADHWNPKPLLLLFFGGAGICGLAAGFFLDNPTALTLCLAGVGLFSGIYHPIGLGLISKEVKRISVGMAYNGMAGNVGLATAPLLAGLSNWLFGPKGVYAVLGMLNLAGLFLMVWMKVDSSAEEKVAKKVDGASAVLPFILLLTAAMLGGVAYRGATVILPTAFELKGQGIYQWLLGLYPSGLSANVIAATLTSIIYVIGIWGQYLGGRTAERFDPRWSYLVFHLLTLPPIFLMALASDMPLVLLSVVYFFFLLGMQPIENTLIARLTPPRFHHSAFGAKFILTFGVGALAVKLVGKISAASGLSAVFPALGLVSIMLVIIVLILISRTRTGTDHQTTLPK